MSVIVSFSAASYLSPATFSYHVAVLAFTSSIFIDWNSFIWLLAVVNCSCRCLLLLRARLLNNLSIDCCDCCRLLLCNFGENTFNVFQCSVFPYHYLSPLLKLIIKTINNASRQPIVSKSNNAFNAMSSLFNNIFIWISHYAFRSLLVTTLASSFTSVGTLTLIALVLIIIFSSLFILLYYTYI